MVLYEFEFQHSENTFKSLAHMQYNMFCRRNRLSRGIVAIISLGFAMKNLEFWWSYLLIAYGAYLYTGTYSQANNTARKLARQIVESGSEFPKSRYCFEEDGLHVYMLPENKEATDPLPYTEVEGIGEDLQYLYIFRDRYGGYMMKKDAMEDDDHKAFRRFLREKTGKPILFKGAPVGKLVGFTDRFRKK